MQALIIISKLIVVVFFKSEKKIFSKVELYLNLYRVPIKSKKRLNQTPKILPEINQNRKQRSNMNRNIKTFQNLNFQSQIMFTQNQMPTRRHRQKLGNSLNKA